MLRRATLADVPALVGLRRLMFAEMGVPDADAPAWQERAAEWLADAVASPDHRVLVVEDAGEVVACGIGDLRRGAPSPGVPHGVQVYVHTMATQPWARRQGHATAILEALADWAREVGAERLELHASPAGRPLYERHGYRPAASPSMRRDLRAH